MSTTRTFVVDDFEEWRQFICATLQEIPDVVIVGEASDGLKAVQKIEELLPDLVLLDIGLPSLNGIEVARRITRNSPLSKIIFVTEDRSPDLLDECFRVGGIAFVRKSNAASELTAVIQAALSKKPS